VFSNDEPKLQNDKGNLTLSADRWNIINLTDKEEEDRTHYHRCIPSSTRKRKSEEEYTCNSTFCKICLENRHKRIQACKKSTNGSMIPLAAYTNPNPRPLNDNALPFVLN